MIDGITAGVVEAAEAAVKWINTISITVNDTFVSDREIFLFTGNISVSLKCQSVTVYCAP